MWSKFSSSIRLFARIQPLATLFQQPAHAQMALFGNRVRINRPDRKPGCDAWDECVAQAHESNGLRRLVAAKLDITPNQVYLARSRIQKRLRALQDEVESL